mmetsp:Transcript_22604/g.51725  ORF Transcript_22604/g.51725 Transcript_22604/m.51725 type:complete len:387 (+) Transcript_22604:59-1219(+)
MGCLAAVLAAVGLFSEGLLVAFRTPTLVEERRGPCPGCLAVFHPGLNGSRCYRIPMILKTQAGTLLAVAENRINGCGDNGGRHDLVARRSTDNGQTWGELILVYRAQVPCPNCPDATSNPNLVEVDFHNGSSAILMHFDTLNNPDVVHHGLDMQIWSHDDGKTWGRVSKINYGKTLANMGGMIGPSQGLQGASGTIYFSARGVGGQNVSNYLYWSHDFGETWEASADRLNRSFGNEAAIAFLVSPEDERIIMSIRTTKGRRAQAIWSRNQSGYQRVDSVNASWPAGLVDPGCQGSIVNQGGVLYLSNPSSLRYRQHMTVKSSHDQGKTWSAGRLVWQKASAYSQLVPLGDDKLGLLFEAGVTNPSDTISFVLVDASDEWAAQTLVV